MRGKQFAIVTAMIVVLIGAVVLPASGRTRASQPAFADLSVRITDSPDPAITLLDQISYEITVTNAGPNSTWTKLSAELDGVAMRPAATASQGSCYSTADIWCSLYEIRPGASARVSVTTRATGAEDLTLSARIWGSLVDPNTSNNQASETTTVLP